MIRMRHNIMSPGARKRNRAEKASQQSGLAGLIVKALFHNEWRFEGAGNMINFFTGENSSQARRFENRIARSSLGRFNRNDGVTCALRRNLMSTSKIRPRRSSAT
jgi:hypothetical protein